MFQLNSNTSSAIITEALPLLFTYGSEIAILFTIMFYHSLVTLFPVETTLNLL